MARKRNAAGGDRGARNSDLLAGVSGSVDSQSPIVEQDPLRAVYDGREQIGLIYADGDRFLAVTPHGRRLGRFKTIAAATTAIYVAAADRIIRRDDQRRARQRGRAA